MSELTNGRRDNIRRNLLTTVSALAFFTSMCAIDQAQAADGDADRPTVWVELGVQSENVSGFGDPVAPPFTQALIADGFTSPLSAQHALNESFGGEGKVSFQPKNTEWVFSASFLYGRANGKKAVHDQAPNLFHVSRPTSYGVLTSSRRPFHSSARFSDIRINNEESHAVLDFQAGKDVGLGLFGSGGKSTFSFGVRLAQLTSKQSLALHADPDLYFPKSPLLHPKYHHTYFVTSHAERSFRGLGPSLSWHASKSIIGNPSDGGISLDWGMNAAILFGRQKVQGHHQTTGSFVKSAYLLKYHLTTHIHRSGAPSRSHSVVVPNLGGFAGASFQFSNAKVSFGYRCDFFFGAMDGGIDTPKSETLGFYGPFASISVGLP